MRRAFSRARSKGGHGRARQTEEALPKEHPRADHQREAHARRHVHHLLHIRHAVRACECFTRRSLNPAQSQKQKQRSADEFEESGEEVFAEVLLTEASHVPGGGVVMCV
ncbi:unnamed protein product [Mycena citricolor]|uniref:Uncharacterized protein n=1 Tax=Mycena citricolor TaxID=2018698 RepID=A0AAD2JYT2_9AGAR|nr:unnamed protein product [Mycena citricolor]